MATFPVKPLDGADGYLRWKESVLLRLHTVGVAHVLSDEPPAPDGSRQAAKKWERDDAMCRGHILAALSDHLLPVYVRHGTGRALWQAVARTYEPDATYWRLRLEDETHRERVARVESLVIVGRGFLNNPKPSDDGSVPYCACRKLPDVVKEAIMHGDGSTMDGLWRTAEAMERGDTSVQIWEAGRKNERISSGHNAKRPR